MRTLLTLYLFFLGFTLFSQGEANKWVVSPNSLIDFSSGVATLTNLTTVGDFYESITCISDQNGNFLFYSDGATVWGVDNNVLPNGNNLSPESSTAIRTTTQGSLFVNSPSDTNQYYLFSLSFNGTLSFSILDRTLNGGLGAVISKQNVLVKDTLSEKMAVTKHCDNKSFWLVIIKYKDLKYLKGPSANYTLEFQSYLINQYGVQSDPIKSQIKTLCPKYGQMKFNNAGTELAFAENNTLVLFDFDKASGKVSLKREVELPLDNGYGVEYAPNDSIIYINEKQFDLYSNALTPLQSFPTPGQLQRGADNKIYGYSFPEDEVNMQISTTSGFYGNGNWVITANKDEQTNLFSISSPTIPGALAQYLPNAITINHVGNFRNYFALPYLAAYHFNHKVSDFNHSGSCINSPIDFFLSNENASIDSIHWYVPDLDLFSNAAIATFSFPYAGQWTVECTVFLNGDSTTSTQCVNICGKGSLNLPQYVDICESEPFEINELTPCASSYLWNTGDTTSSLFIESEGTYILEITTECGVFSDTMEVVKSKYCNVKTEIPNIITANNDGINDLFTVKYKNTVGFEFVILNRWGNVIHQGYENVPSSNVFNWNSSSLWGGALQSGKQVEDGTYFYKITFETFNGSKEEKSGFIQVVR